MSGAIVGATAGAGSAAAAAAARARMQEEEEKLTTYHKDDMDGWEFKIIRSYQKYFKKPENLRKIREEEARAGWEMVEKFDDYRVRFKRRIDKRQNDQFLKDIDPYRTQVGLSSGRLAAIIIWVSILVVGLILGMVFFIQAGR